MKKILTVMMLAMASLASGQSLEIAYGRGYQADLPSLGIGYDFNNYIGGAVKGTLINGVIRKGLALNLTTNTSKKVYFSFAPEIGISKVIYCTWNIKTFYQGFFIGLGSFESKATYNLGYKWQLFM